MADDSIDLSLLRAAVLDASPPSIVADSLSLHIEAQRWKIQTAPEQGSMAISQYEQDAQPDSIQVPLKDLDSEPALQTHNSARSSSQTRAHAPKKPKMATGGTQRSDHTDPLSQWAYECTPVQSHMTEVIGPRTMSKTKTYRTGEMGHVQLELELGTQEVEDLPLEEEEDECRTEPFPQSQRFLQQPKTPASSGRKRKRSDGGNHFATPSAGANPFGSSATKAGAPLRMSQIFQASSPFPNQLPSDPISGRPSPNFNDMGRPSIAHIQSSPLKSAPHRRAVTAPHTSWRSRLPPKDTEDSSPLAALEIEEEESFSLPASEIRRQAVQVEKAKAERELRSVDANLIAEGLTPPKRKTQRSISRKRSTLPAMKRVEPTESEVETDIEGSPGPEPALVGSSDDELGENNKENIALSRSRMSAAVRSPHDSGIKIRRTPRQDTRYVAIDQAEAESADELADPSPTRNELVRNRSSEGNGDKTIVDSQRSPPPEALQVLTNIVAVVPRSTDDTGKVVCESQTVKIAASSPVIAISQGKTASSSLGLPASSPNIQSIPTTAQKLAKTARKDVAMTNGHLSGDIRTGTPSAINEEQTPCRHDTCSLSIPETSIAPRFQSHPAASKSSQSRHSEPLSKPLSRASKLASQESGIFHLAQTQPKVSVEEASSLVTPESSQHSTAAEFSQPMPLMSIGQLAETQEDDPIAMSLRLLESNDPLYDEVMGKYSSPISAARKRRAKEEAMNQAQAQSITPMPRKASQNRKEKAPSSLAADGKDPTSSAVGSLLPEGAESMGQGDALDAVPTGKPVQSSQYERLIEPPSSSPPRSIKKHTRKRRARRVLDLGSDSLIASDTPINSSASAEVSTPSHSKTRPKSKAISLPTTSSQAPPKRSLRVFAYFSGSARPGYYPATCLSITPTEMQFKVQFDDDNTTQLPSSKVKPLDLQVGDAVRIDRNGLRNVNYIVKGCSASASAPASPEVSPEKRWLGDNNSNLFVHVLRNTASAKDSEAECFPISAVYLISKTFRALKRGFKQSDLAALPNSINQGLRTPPDRPSTPATPESRLRPSKWESKTSGRYLGSEGDKAGLFRGMYFVLTNVDKQSLRQEAMKEIELNGGKVLQDGFETVFELPQVLDRTSAPQSRLGSPSAPQLRSSSALPPIPGTSDGAGISSAVPPLTSSSAASAKESEPEEKDSEKGRATSDIKPRPAYKGQTLFLLATRHCRHTKYFQALALGIPCLSVRWIAHCVAAGKLVAWQPYLLASGESAILDGAMISQTTPLLSSVSIRCSSDVDGREEERFRLEDALTHRPRLFAGQRVLLVSVDGGGGQSQLEAHAFLSFALGASAVGWAEGEEAAIEMMEAREVDGEGTRGRHAAAEQKWTMLIATGSEVVDTSAASGRAGVASSGRTSKRARRGKKEEEDGDRGDVLAGLVGMGARGVSTEFVIQSLVLGRLL